ncbi:MAG: sugar transferase [Myxococcales bacterium]|nr:sugar transferase [Myxococcales bacterium]
MPPDAKRLLDLTLGGLATVALAPAALGAVGALLALDGRPVLFRQTRVGQGRAPLTVLKLRTFRDGRVTRVGRWLRATGLDELPQLVHVLRGEMSLVGPRPLTPEDVRRLGWDAPRYDPRWSVRPGITGPAQLHDGPCDARVSWRFDRAYVARASAGHDLSLLLGSALALALGKRRARRLLSLSRRRRPSGRRSRAEENAPRPSHAEDDARGLSRAEENARRARPRANDAWARLVRRLDVLAQVAR